MCGVIGLAGRPEAVMWASRGLYALQHRGHDSCGIAHMNEDLSIEVLADKGAVADVFPNDVTEKIDAKFAIGQNLYTTYGTKHSLQPFGGRFWDENGKVHHIAIVHNGQLCGVDHLRRKYPIMCTTHSDSEVIFALIPHMPGNSIVEKIKHLIEEIEGAYSLIIMSEEGLTAIRDPSGFRPLIMGHDTNGAVLFASEVNAFDIMEGSFDRQVMPGEIIHVDIQGKVTSSNIEKKAKHLSQCVFEHIYFARPDNFLFGKPGYSTQKQLGAQTAMELKGKLDADVVIPVPDSANIASLGFAETMDLPFQFGLLRHHFASRTFITRGQVNRERAVRLKFNVVKDVVQGKRVILADDSLVRSTTSKILIDMIRKGGASEIHMVLFSPQILYSCIYGINTPTREELIAYKCSESSESIAKSIKAESVHYLSMDGLKKVMGENKDDYCYACMDGKYPIPQAGTRSSSQNREALETISSDA